MADQRERGKGKKREKTSREGRALPNFAPPPWIALKDVAALPLTPEGGERGGKRDLERRTLITVEPQEGMPSDSTCGTTLLQKREEKRKGNKERMPRRFYFLTTLLHPSLVRSARSLLEGKRKRESRGERGNNSPSRFSPPARARGLSLFLERKERRKRKGEKGR